MTMQRQIILDVIDRSREHLTADDITARAQRLDRSINPSTVYRSLTLLKERGLIKSRYYDQDSHREVFEPTPNTEHYHFTCSRCGKVIEFESSVDTTWPAWCVRYRLKHTDRNAVLARNRTLLVEDFGVTCLHPDKKDLVVDVGYSERGRAAELKSELKSDLTGLMISSKLAAESVRDPHAIDRLTAVLEIAQRIQQRLEAS